MPTKSREVEIVIMIKISSCCSFGTEPGVPHISWKMKPKHLNRALVDGCCSTGHKSSSPFKKWIVSQTPMSCEPNCDNTKFLPVVHQLIVSTGIMPNNWNTHGFTGLMHFYFKHIIYLYVLFTYLYLQKYTAAIQGERCMIW